MLQRCSAICVVRSAGCHRLGMPFTFARCKCACIRTHKKRACMRKAVSAALMSRAVTVDTVRI